jgi:hypothetical protein
MQDEGDRCGAKLACISDAYFVDLLHQLNHLWIQEFLSAADRSAR